MYNSHCLVESIDNGELGFLPKIQVGCLFISTLYVGCIVVSNFLHCRL